MARPSTYLLRKSNKINRDHLVPEGTTAGNISLLYWIGLCIEIIVL